MNKKIDIYIYNYLEIKIYLFILKFSDILINLNILLTKITNKAITIISLKNNYN